MRSSCQLSFFFAIVTILDGISRHVSFAAPTSLTKNEALLDQDKGYVSIIKSPPNEGLAVSRAPKITLRQLLVFTHGQIPSDVIEESFSQADLDKDGLLDQREGDLAAAIAMRLTQNKINRAITEADIAADGLLDVGEAQHAAEQVNINGIDSAFINGHFKQADQNGDQRLNVDEITSLISAGQPPIEQLLDQFDSDNNGTLNKNELIAFASLFNMDFAALYQAAVRSDSNRDGELSATELSNALGIYGYFSKKMAMQP